MVDRVAAAGHKRAPRWYVVLGLLVGASVWMYLSPPSANDQTPIVLTGATMGTRYTVKLAAHGDDPRARAEAATVRILDGVVAKMSTYEPSSEISRFANAPAGVAFSLSAETATVVARALDVARRSGGAFDPTVRPLVDAWGFGPDGRPRTAPDDATIAALMKRVGYRRLSLDGAAHTLTKRVDGVSLDLSAIAKGWAVDRVAEALEKLGFADYLVEVGGEVRARGENARGEPWRIVIEAPAGAEAVAAVVTLDGHGLATSGNYRNYYEDEDGARWVHIIDPRAGAPVRHRLASVSVIHPEAAIADAWATALMVLGVEDGFRVAEENQLAALFLVADGSVGFAPRSTPRFDRYLATRPAERSAP